MFPWHIHLMRFAVAALCGVIAGRLVDWLFPVEQRHWIDWTAILALALIGGWYSVRLADAITAYIRK